MLFSYPDDSRKRPPCHIHQNDNDNDSIIQQNPHHHHHHHHHDRLDVVKDARQQQPQQQQRRRYSIECPQEVPRRPDECCPSPDRCDYHNDRRNLQKQQQQQQQQQQQDDLHHLHHQQQQQHPHRRLPALRTTTTTTVMMTMTIAVAVALLCNIPPTQSLELQQQQEQQEQGNNGEAKLEAPGQQLQQQQQIHFKNKNKEIPRGGMNNNEVKPDSKQHEQLQKDDARNESSLSKLKFKELNLLLQQKQQQQQQQQQQHQQQQQSSTSTFGSITLSNNPGVPPPVDSFNQQQQQQQHEISRIKYEDWANPPPPPPPPLQNFNQQQQPPQQQPEPFYDKSRLDVNNANLFQDPPKANWDQHQHHPTWASPGRASPQPTVDREERKSVEWNYNVNYYALKASSDSRFLIRYSPPASPGSPWPLPQYYDNSNKVLAIEPTYLLVEATLNNRKYPFRESHSEPGATQNDDFYNSNNNNDDDNNNEEGGDSCSVLDFNVRRFKIVAFGGHYDRDTSILTEDRWSKHHLVASDDNYVNGDGDGDDDDDEKKTKRVKNLVIKIAAPCQKDPHLHMNESYDLRIEGHTVTLSSPEVWGAVRGLETLSQLIYQKESDPFKFWINETYVRDFPRFRHRGILLDTSRHYLDMETLMENLESMAQNKFNVFHWHIVDDQSFPFVSHAYPNLTRMGAYDFDTHVYSQEDVKLIMEFARLRGIRVIPEFDTPGHTFSWGFGQNHLLTPCHDFNGDFNGLYGPINPILRKNYAFLRGLFREIMGLFRDKYIHLGGDEVPFECWLSNPQIKRFMKKNSINDIKQILSFYARQLLSLVSNNAKELKRQTGSIVWQEMFDNDVELPLDTIIQVWSGDSFDLERITRSGYGVLFSTCWYLDYIQYGQDWDKYYLCDQIANLRLKNESLFYGGEVCLWAEYTDDSDIMTRLWPRAAAAAERLWSDKGVNNLYRAAERLEAQRCRMMERGMQVGVLSGPSHCTKFRQKRRALSPSNNNNNDRDDHPLDSPLSSVKNKRPEGVGGGGGGGGYQADDDDGRHHDKRRLNRYGNPVEPNIQAGLHWSNNNNNNNDDDARTDKRVKYRKQTTRGASSSGSMVWYLTFCLVTFMLFVLLKKKWIKLPLGLAHLSSHLHPARSYRAFVVCLIVLTAAFIWLEHVRFFSSRLTPSQSAVVERHKMGGGGGSSA